jgi:hypothetical protein
VFLCGDTSDTEWKQDLSTMCLRFQNIESKFAAGRFVIMEITYPNANGPLPLLSSTERDEFETEFKSAQEHMGALEDAEEEAAAAAGPPGEGVAAE